MQQGSCTCVSASNSKHPQWAYKAGGEEHVKMGRNHGGTDSEETGQERTGSSFTFIKIHYMHYVILNQY